MKNIRKINLLYTFFGIIVSLLVMVNFTSCIESEYSGVTPNQNALNSNIELNYENLIKYTFKEVFTSTPSFDMGTYAYAFKSFDLKFNGDVVPDGVFSIDKKTGAITIDNTEDKLDVGIYTVDLQIQNVAGLLNVENAFTIEILDMPLDATSDPATVDVEFLEVKDIATITAVDTSESGDVLEGITFSLVGAPDGIMIDNTTGVISKNRNAPAGVHQITVTIATTNLGSKTFENIVTVTVGDKPAVVPGFKYVQADGTTTLTNVTLGSNTAYATVAPIMEAIDLTQPYAIILPTELQAYNITMNADASISVAADQNLPVGVYAIGVQATDTFNVSFDYEGLFTVTVGDAEWTQVYFNDFNIDPSTGAYWGNNKRGEIVDPDYLKSYAFGNSSFIATGGKEGTDQHLHSMRLNVTSKTADRDNDAVLSLKLVMDESWQEMRVSFNEMFSLNQAVYDSYGKGRTLSFSHNVDDLDGGIAFNNEGQQTTIMAGDAADWSTDSQWVGASDDTMNKIVGKNVPFTAGEEFIYLNWRVQKLGDDVPAGIWIDDIKVEVLAGASGAVEN